MCGRHDLKRHLHCAEQQVCPSNLTKYCACYGKWLSWLILVPRETLFTMRGATGVTIQPHQILRLPRKMTLMIDPRHVWNVISTARSISNYPATETNSMITSKPRRHTDAAHAFSCSPGSSKKQPQRHQEVLLQHPLYPQLNVEVSYNGRPRLLKWLFFLKAVVYTRCAQHWVGGRGARRAPFDRVCVGGCFFWRTRYCNCQFAFV